MSGINLVQEEQEQEFSIVEIKQYIDENSGMSVVEHIPVQDGKQSNGFTLVEDRPIKRFGKAFIPTQMGNMPFQFNFPEDMSVLECFEKFTDYAEQALENLQKESQNQIIVPQGIDADSLRTK